MKENKIFKYLEEIEGGPTAHLSGFKKVFLNNEETDTKLTQFAYGKFEPGEICESHVHPTMEELFYFFSGYGEYLVDGRIVQIKPSTFLRIPANLIHELRNTGDTDLEFVYFGIAIE